MTTRRIRVERFVFPPDTTYPLFITANRYWQDRSSVENTSKSKSETIHYPEVTLILLHSTSFNKETWEACLETLLNLSTPADGKKSPNIREAWSIECPNHGESAALNAEAFESPEFSQNFGCDGYARAVHRFLTQGPVSFSSRNLVGIGHSLGANTMLIVQTLCPRLPFSSVIIVEPMVSPGGTDPLEPLRKSLVASAEKRRDIWASRDEVRLWLLERHGSRGRKKRRVWDKRVVDSIVKFGIRPVSPESSAGSSDRTKQDRDVTLFTLACTKKQEIAMYLDERGPNAAVEILDRISSTLPIHLVLGQVKDYMQVPAAVHDALTGPAPGRHLASVSLIPDVGHLIPQEKPDELAIVLFRILKQITSNAIALAKL